jgi:hypothetical protein
MTITIHYRLCREVRMPGLARDKSPSGMIEMLPVRGRMKLEDLWAGRNRAMRHSARLAA